MNKIAAEYTGSFAEFTKFMETSFKDPGPMNLTVTVNHVVNTNPTVLELLVEKCLKGFSFHESVPVEMLRTMPTIIDLVRGNQKIQAIKAIRTVTNLGLKESKDMVEGPIQNYIDHGA